MVELLIPNQLVSYSYALQFMEKRVQQIYNNSANELLWIIEHPPIYTAGITAKDDEMINALFPIYKTNRGGKYMYHGPGQRVIYLMLNLKKRKRCNIRLYIKDLSQWMINVLQRFNIIGEFKEDRIGIWVCHNNIEEKIVAFGIRIKKWITYHGLALNISPNLSHYKGIIPCGLKEYNITSMEKLGVQIITTVFDNVLIQEFYKIF
ncbi:lipoyl(octanoyl) transferase LipB [Wolbachia endosymbiont of Howardula sp.]|uniref:lipoyl(octanoyl) transferase LipB n=1 Tax=Wolbachia endosymbiont of Howardula sp. TaxID=2916816 RepID=UPI00217D9AE5|nr:lipoyl(octanoyl) transferase LipB [Wolbachia endosymbiont of Howardula sp.]UWI83199.1 lipoyl(octanoyl) transferase LipB [Wolbachia endosymbiont of Howardula sp.]